MHLLADGKLLRVAVKTGISGKLEVGDEVIVADLAGKQDSASMPRGRLF